MITQNILFILQYKVSTTVTDLVVVFRLFVGLFMLALLSFCVATVFSVNKDSYNYSRCPLPAVHGLCNGRVSVRLSVRQIKSVRQSVDSIRFSIHAAGARALQRTGSVNVLIRGGSTQTCCYCLVASVRAMWIWHDAIDRHHPPPEYNCVYWKI